jgi:tetratricopeptide (TPR) repeat protein
MLDEAESTYRSRNVPQAMDAYATLLEIDPSNLHAWLRVGNLYQQSERHDDAMAAYRQATASLPQTRADFDTRGKALANIALIGIEQAQRALDELDALNDERLASLRNEVGVQFEKEAGRLQRARDVSAMAAPAPVRPTAAAASSAGRIAAPAGARLPPPVQPMATGQPIPTKQPAASVQPATTLQPAAKAPPATPAQPATQPQATGQAADAFEPYTVDRWAGKPRRPLNANAPAARPSLRDPITEDPLPSRPRIDYFEGAPDGRTRPQR